MLGVCEEFCDLHVAGTQRWSYESTFEEILEDSFGGWLKIDDDVFTADELMIVVVEDDDAVEYVEVVVAVVEESVSRMWSIIVGVVHSALQESGETEKFALSLLATLAHEVFAAKDKFVSIATLCSVFERVLPEIGECPTDILYYESFCIYTIVYIH